MRLVEMGREKNKVNWHYTAQGQTNVRHGFVESFNGKLRGECLEPSIYSSIITMPVKLLNKADNDYDYNYNAPHSSLKGMTPIECTRQQKHSKTQTNLYHNWG